jgi:hypothetical protein
MNSASVISDERSLINVDLTGLRPTIQLATFNGQGVKEVTGMA